MTGAPEPGDAASPRVPDSYRRDGRHQDFVLKVDLIVRKDTDYRRTEFARRRRVQLGDLNVAIVAPVDLIISTLDWVRDTRSAIQLADVRNLLRAVPDLDRQYLARWTARLGLTDAYREAEA